MALGNNLIRWFTRHTWDATGSPIATLIFKVLRLVGAWKNQISYLTTI